VPSHSVSSGHPSRWSWLAAVVAVAALVLVVRPAIGHGQLAGNGSPDPAAAAAPAPLATTSSPTRSRAPKPASKPAPKQSAPPSRTPAAPATTAAAAEIPVSASGRLAVVPGRVAPAGPGRPMTYRLEIEQGLPLDGAAVAAQVHRVLIDPRGWQPIEKVAFSRTDGDASFELIIASPALTDRLCYPLDTIGELSCRNGGPVVRGPDGRLPRLPGQPRGGPPARARPQDLPGTGRAGPGDAPAEQVAVRLQGQPLAVRGSVTVGGGPRNPRTASRVRWWR
jgi:Protein of unknown function (DUF3152)